MRSLQQRVAVTFLGREDRSLVRQIEPLTLAYNQTATTPIFVELDPDQLANMRDNDYLETHGLGDAIPGVCGLITLAITLSMRHAPKMKKSETTKR